MANGELFAKIFLANIHSYTENVYGICTDCCLYTKFFPYQIFPAYGMYFCGWSVDYKASYGCEQQI